MDLTQSQLKVYLHYNPETGVFTWLQDRGRRFKAGEVAGSKDPKGYIKIGLLGKDYKAHRLAVLYMTGELPGPSDVDHKNEIKDDNVWDNIRVATRSQNTFNFGKKSHNTSGLKGAFRDSAGWKSAIRIDGKRIHLGRFDTAEDAHRAYIAAAKKYHGEFFSERSEELK